MLKTLFITLKPECQWKQREHLNHLQFKCKKKRFYHIHNAKNF